MSSRVVKITVISDVVCSYCYVGHQELLDAITHCTDVLNLPISFEVEYRPFRLIGCLGDDAQCNMNKETFYSNKLGKEKFENVMQSIRKWGSEKDINFTWKGVMAQSTLAHRLSRKAFLLGGQRFQLPFLSAIFKASFQDEKDISNIEVLSELAEDVGMMTKDEAVTFLKSDELKEEVHKMCEDARAKGITGIPMTVIDRKWSVNGSQCAKVFIQIFKKLADCGVHAAPSPFGGSMVEIAA